MVRDVSLFWKMFKKNLFFLFFIIIFIFIIALLLRMIKKIRKIRLMTILKERDIFEILWTVNF